jgi:hypothetical protein
MLVGWASRLDREDGEIVGDIRARRRSPCRTDSPARTSPGPSVSPAFCSSRSFGFLIPPVPWQQFVQTLNRMIRDAGEHVSEPGARIDVIKFGGDDQRIHRRRPFAASIRSGEQP